MQHWTETAIKAALDGTFTTIDRINNGVRTKEVDVDFLPDHFPPPQPPRDKGIARRPRHQWTPDEDLELLRLRRLGWSKMRCSHAFNVTEEALRKRILVLREPGA